MPQFLPLGRTLPPIESIGYPPRTEDVRLTSVLVILRRRWGWVVGSLIVTVALVAAYTLRSAPVYEATSVLRFELQKVNLPQLMQQFATNENQIGTEMAVLQQRSLARPVIDSLGLRAELVVPKRTHTSDVFAVLRVAPSVDTLTLELVPAADGRVSIRESGSSSNAVLVRIGDTAQVAGVTLSLRPAAVRVPEIQLQIVSMGEAVARFESALKVSRPARDADLVAITVGGSDPSRAAAGANLLARQLIISRRGVQLAQTGSTVGFLRRQLDTLGVQLAVAEEALRAYRERAGVVNVDEQSRTQVGRLAQIQADRGGVEAERQALAMLLQQMKSDSGRAASGGQAPSRRLISFPTLFRNQAASELLGSLARIEDQRSTLLTRRTALDPDVQALTTRIRELDAQLQGIAETYLQGLTNQVASLADVARRFGGALDSLPAKEVQTARLEREVRVQQDLYTLIQTRLKEAEITQAMDDPSIRVVDAAITPSRPVRPRPIVNLALSLVLGSILGMGAAFYRDLSDRAVRSRSDVMRASGLPILAAIPHLHSPRQGLLTGRMRNKNPNAYAATRRIGAVPLPVGAPNGSPAGSVAARLVTRPGVMAGYVESFNQLYANLALTHQEHPLKVLVVTSPLPGEGKTLSASNLALTLAGRGLNVLFVDGDLRCGLVNEVFGCPRAPGFAELLSSSVRFEEAAHSIAIGDIGSLTILPSGARLQTPGRLLEIEHVRAVLSNLAPQFDLVIVDSPPVNLLADAALLGSAADGVILVIRAGHTSMEELTYAIDQLTAARAPVVGTLLNDIDPRRGEDDGSYRYLAEVERYYVSDFDHSGRSR
ncbi:MAG: capsular exopolysaccharide family [Gemmatimonadetes bacterium]|nr:capsular exopolysaccharide family [Gemmatimonadota bacterium]